MTLSDRLNRERKPQPPHLIVIARAGTGKTTTLVEGLKVLRGQETPFDPSPQQAAIWEALRQSPADCSACFVAFNKSIATELQQRVPDDCDAMTMHSMGFASVRQAFDFRVQVEGNRVLKILDDLLGPDAHRRQPELFKAVRKLVGLCKLNLIGCDIPGNRGDWYDSEGMAGALADLAAHYDVDLNGNEWQVFTLVPQVLDQCEDVSCDRCVDFDDMIWLPVVLDLHVRRYDLLLVDEAQDLNRCQQALALKAGRRLVLCGDPKQCLLPGTMIYVSKPEWENGRDSVEIETLCSDDYQGAEGSGYWSGRVISFNPNTGYFCGQRTQGKRIEAVHTEEIEEEIVSLANPLDSDYFVECTRNHRWWARFSPKVRESWCLYAMRRGQQARIGICKLNYSCGIGPGARARSEIADAVWILDIFDSETEARVEEQIASSRFGLPQTTFQNRGNTHINQDIIDAIYDGLGDLTTNLIHCLNSFGRLLEYPIWEKSTSGYLSFTKGAVYHACNLIDGAFQLRQHDESRSGSWVTISVKRRHYKGPVYGITVEPTERDLRLYVASGFVSHNSIYGFAGADSESVGRMADTLAVTQHNASGMPCGVVQLPLTVTRRCGRAIVREAQRYVPDFEAHESCGEGVVLELNMKEPECICGSIANHESYCGAGQGDYRSFIHNGDMILCRCNAPLVSECFRFLRAGRKATIQGRDVGQGLVRTIRKLVKGDPGGIGSQVSYLLRRLSDWLYAENYKENAKRHPSDARLIALQDRYDCIAAFCEDETTVDAVVAKITAVFSDEKNGEGIKLSSVHKAKGLEADRVFILMPKEAPMPHPMAKSDWEREQELNILYVAITRAKNELIYVT